MKRPPFDDGSPPALWAPALFAESDGRIPFERFADSLSDFKFIALDTAVARVLCVRGLELARTEWLKPLGNGLHEFRVRHDGHEIARMFGGTPAGIAAPVGRVLLRVFVHFCGEKQVLLLGGYDKGADPSKRRQRRETAAARRRLAEFRHSRP